ncbi:MAG: DNA repair protein RadC [Bacteroidota bacterium]
MTYYTRLPITSWAEEDKPREKLLKRGISSLTDAELLGILFGTGTREVSAIDLGRKVLEEVGNLHQLARTDVRELMKIKGIGKAKAVTLVSAFELARRKGISAAERIKISSSESVANYLSPKLEDLNQEVFYLLFLNRNNEIKAEKMIFQGGVSATVIDPKIVFKEAINHLASAMIVAHNHPSGNLTPSKADHESTRKLVAAGKLFDIHVLDHIIISIKGYYSFADHGLI